MTLLLAATATLLALAVVVLFSPVSVTVDAAGDAAAARMDIRVRIRWLGVSIPIARSARQPRPARSQRNRRASGAGIRAMLCSRGFLERSARLIVELAKRVRPTRLEVTGRLGFDDPSDTGALMGWMHLGGVRREWCYIDITPDYTTEVLEGRLHLLWKRNAASLLWPALRFVASPVFWRAIGRYRAAQNSR